MDAGGSSDDKHEEAGGDGIEGTAVAYFPLIKAPANKVDDIVGGFAGGFIGEKEAVELRDHFYERIQGYGVTGLREVGNGKSEMVGIQMLRLGWKQGVLKMENGVRECKDRSWRVVGRQAFKFAMALVMEIRTRSRFFSASLVKRIPAAAL